MSRALLVFESGDNNITLESGSLLYIDLCTRRYTDEEDIKNKYSYRLNNIDEDGKIKVYNIMDRSLREELPILINDKEPILLRDRFDLQEKSELEITRKLLFNSKNRMFLKQFISDKKCEQTLNFAMPLTYKECLYCNKNDLKTMYLDDTYCIDVYQLFEYISTCKKMGPLRRTFEDALEAWKKKMLDLDNDDLYYYSRKFRLMSIDYNRYLKKKIGIKHLNINNKKVLNVYEKYTIVEKPKIKSLSQHKNVNL